MSKPKTREYLEAALEQARRVLPHWMFAAIHSAALPSSGGRAAHNRRMSACEKVWTTKAPLASLSDQELKSLVDATASVSDDLVRKGLNTRGVTVAREALQREVIARDPSKKPNVQEFSEVKKGFNSGNPDGGMHAHGIDRRNSQTMRDGPHVHVFVLPGSGEVLWTKEDGSHAHTLDDNGNAAEVGGAHTHKVVFFGDNRETETKLGGQHSHQLMVETTGFDGLHQHILKLKDGVEVQSLSPGEFYSRFVDGQIFEPTAIFSSRLVCDALNEVLFLREEMYGDSGSPTIEEALNIFAKNGEAPKPPNSLWEVIKVAQGGAYCALKDVEETQLMSNPCELPLAACDIVEVSAHGEIIKHSTNSEPDTFDDAGASVQFTKELEEATQFVDFMGPQSAKLVFVSASPSPLEMARKEALSGQDGALFQQRYLAPLGLSKSDVAVGFAIPVSCSPTEADVDLWRARLLKSISVYGNAKIVALGRIAKLALGDKMDFSLPHPAAVRRHGDRGEIQRKVRSISKALDICPEIPKNLGSSNVKPSNGATGKTLADSISELSKGQNLRVAVTKSSEKKQIVYGVILDPYQVDLHDDWLPPAEIETTAHDFMSESRVIGISHNGVAEATLVESWVEAYPTEEDREAAFSNLPHKAFRRPFGKDFIHSGAWLAGVKLSDELWGAYGKGEIDAFSIGGFSFKTKISSDAMPSVEFIELSAA